MKTKNILYSSLIILALIVAYFFIPFEKRVFFLLLAALALIFLVLGVVLMFQSKNYKDKLDKYVMLAGLSAVAPLALSILHNVFYAFGVLATEVLWLKYIFELHSAVCFIIALLVAPIAFVVFAILSLRKL